MVERDTGMEETVLLHIREINSRIDLPSLDRDKSLLEQGMDSLDLISLFTVLGRETGTEFPPDLDALLSIKQLASFLKSP